MSSAVIIEKDFANDREQQWTEVIRPKASLFDLNLKGVWEYRDLLRMFVRRDFIATYKQTVLGPLWFFIQPILTTVTYMIIFGGIAGISTNGIPQPVFYMAGITVWNYFSDCLTKTSSIFTTNASIFGKVYFPRLIMPLSIVVSGLIRLGIQLLLFLLVWGYFMVKGAPLHPNAFILLVPFLFIVSALMSLGIGMIFSSMTTKYRDLTQLLSFGIQLGMYATPVIYPMSRIPAKYLWIVQLNPLSSIVETFRYAFTGSGMVSWGSLLYSLVFTIVILCIGTVIFNKVEKSFMDTV